MSPDTPVERAQSGLDRLALFLLAVLLILLVTPTLLWFAGVDVRGSTGEDRNRDQPVLTVLGVEGVAVDDDRESIGAVRVTVTNSGGGELDPRDLSATLTFVADGGASVRLVLSPPGRLPDEGSVAL
jgi:hypothetical protein